MREGNRAADHCAAMGQAGELGFHRINIIQPGLKQIMREDKLGVTLASPGGA